MPLVLLCGIPCSGKTRRAEALAEYLESHQKPVQLLSDDFTGGRDGCYADSKCEKIGRARLKSEVERDLNEDNVVILDSLNYIKGYRYELYCVSKYLHTPHCVVVCETPEEMAREWNLAREPSQRYSPDVFDALVMRFEAPDSRNRWDQPSFIISPDDPLPGQLISDALFHRQAPPPNKSTQSHPLFETSFLHKLDRLTQDVVRGIVSAQQDGDSQILLSGSTEKVELPRPVTVAELRRLRRQFISYTKIHPVNDYTKITTLFVQYLNGTIL